MLKTLRRCARTQVHGFFWIAPGALYPANVLALTLGGRSSSDFFPFHVSASLLCRHHHASTLFSVLDIFDT